MTLFRVKEYESISISDIEDTVSRQIGEKYKLTIYPDTLISGALRIQCLAGRNSARGMEDFLLPTKHIGLVPVSREVSLWVEPKVPIGNIDQMAKRYGGIISKDLEELRKYIISNDTSEIMRQKMAEAFIWLAEEIVAEGLSREYQRVEDDSGMLRGGLNVARTVARYASRGVSYKAACTTFERLYDTIPNRIIKTALCSIVSNNTFEANCRRRASLLLHKMRDVRVLSVRELLSLPGRELGATDFGGARYERVVPLAKVLLVDGGIDLAESDGDLFMEPLFIDMSSVFENYVLSLMRELLTDFDVETGNEERMTIPLFTNQFDRLPPGMKSIAVNDALRKSSQRACPDILVFQNGTLKLIADVKYKPIGNANTAKRSDIEQIVTYSERLRQKIALSIHPCLSEAESGLSYSGNIGGISIFLYRINLGEEDLGREESRFAGAIRALAKDSDLLE